MNHIRTTQTAILLPSVFIVACLLAAAMAQAQPVTLEEGDGRAEIGVGAGRIATYVWKDGAVPRPYFANVSLPDGTPITRTYPPDPVLDKGNDDHGTYHPGIWLAFGDLSGADI
jgi:hypothetical protein